ncbi:MAG: PAS domain S-box protein [Dehalococcoidia bacterium]
MTSAESVPLRSLLDVAPDGFVVVDTAGNIVWANQTAHSLFGYRDVELIGRRIDELVPERLRFGHTGHRESYEANPRGRSMGLGLNLSARKKDGTEFPVEISLSPLHTRDGLLVTAIVRDISERKRLEEERNVLFLELETERERDRIAMDLHDGVMQDIYAVALGLELSLDGDDDSRYADAKVVEKSIGQLHEVIRSIRSFIFDLRPRQFSGSLAEGLSNLAEEFAQNSQIATTATIDEKMDVDETTALIVYHVAHESLSNIRKHAGASSVVLTLANVGGTGQLQIRDDGKGFDTNHGPPDGHHGLRNMAARARAINAKFQIDSAPGEGTTLLLEFPANG